MSLYFAGDHVVWAQQAGVLDRKPLATRAQKASLYGWFGGSLCTLLGELYELTGGWVGGWVGGLFVCWFGCLFVCVCVFVCLLGCLVGLLLLLLFLALQQKGGVVPRALPPTRAADPPCPPPP